MMTQPIERARPVWTELRVWTYEGGATAEIPAPRAWAEIFLWKTGRPSARTFFLVGAAVKSDPRAFDWRDFPEQAAAELADETLAFRDDRPAARWPSIAGRPPSKVQLATLRRAAADPEGIVRETLHGARAVALLERGLLETAVVEGQPVRRLSERARELLRELGSENKR